jgi:hypothetical protein
MNAQNVANALWALATLGWQAGEGSMRCALEAAAVRVAPSMNAQEVANTLWALATLGWQDGKGSMRCALEAAAVRVAPSMNAQGVANTVWALARLGWQGADGSMRCALEAAAVRVAPSMKPLDVASTLWSLATLGWQGGEGSMRCALEAAAVRVAPMMHSRHLANIKWALARLGWQGGEGSAWSALQEAVARLRRRSKHERIEHFLAGDAKVTSCDLLVAMAVDGMSLRTPVGGADKAQRRDDAEDGANSNIVMNSSCENTVIGIGTSKDEGNNGIVSPGPDDDSNSSPSAGTPRLQDAVTRDAQELEAPRAEGGSGDANRRLGDITGASVAASEAASEQPGAVPSDVDYVECSVCLELLDPKKNRLNKTICGHDFHEECLHKYFVDSIKKKTQAHCPYCRGPLQNEEAALPTIRRNELDEWRSAQREQRATKLRARTVNDLKALCAANGLDKTGNKADLVQRLCDEP